MTDEFPGVGTPRHVQLTEGHEMLELDLCLTFELQLTRMPHL